MTTKTAVLKAAAALACCLAGLACAQEAAPPAAPALRLNGFGTVGLLRSHAPAGWGFRRDISQPANDGGTRADIDTRLGLQLNAALDEKLELVGQLLLKRRLAEEPASNSIEWAFASYRPAPEWTVRVGRTNPDIFLLSDYRNVGFAYPWVRPETGFYGALPLYSLDGADVARSWQVGAALWKLKALVGRGATWSASADGLPAANLHVRSLAGFTLTREAEGLTLRATALQARMALDHVEGGEMLRAALEPIAALPLPAVQAQARALQRALALDPGALSFLELGSAYEGRQWLWSAEIASFQGSFASSHMVNAYAGLGRRFGPFTLYGLLAASRTKDSAMAVPAWAAELTPLLGPQLAQQAQALGTAAAGASNGERLAQRSLSLGLRWDLHPRAALKLQWDRYRVDDAGSLLFSNANGQGGRVDVGSAVLDFVF